MSKEVHDTTQPVFRLKPTPYNNSCVIKHVGYLTEKEKLGDERVEFDTPVEIQNQYGKNVEQRDERSLRYACKAVIEKVNKIIHGV